MARIDKLKEQLGVLKVWLGIVVASMFGIIGWIVINFGEVSLLKIVLAIFAIIPLFIALMVINDNINEKLDQIEKE